MVLRGRQEKMERRKRGVCGVSSGGLWGNEGETSMGPTQYTTGFIYTKDDMFPTLPKPSKQFDPK